MVHRSKIVGPGLWFRSYSNCVIGDGVAAKHLDGGAGVIIDIFCLWRAHSFDSGAINKSFAECRALFAAWCTLIVLLITCVPYFAPLESVPSSMCVSSWCVLLLHQFPVSLLLSWLTRRCSRFSWTFAFPWTTDSPWNYFVCGGCCNLRIGFMQQ